MKNMPFNPGISVGPLMFSDRVYADDTAIYLPWPTDAPTAVTLPKSLSKSQSHF